jgi:hypothetical protein
MNQVPGSESQVSCMNTVEKMGEICLARRVINESGQRRQPGGAARPNDLHVNRGAQAPVIGFAREGVLVGPRHGTIRS